MKFSWFAVFAILFGLVMTTTAQSRKSSVCAESSKDSAVSENVILSVCNHTFGMAPLIQPRLFFRLYADGQAEFEIDTTSVENTYDPNHGLLLKKMRVEPKDVETIRKLVGENNFQNSKAEYPVFQRWTDSSLQTTIIVHLKGLEKKIVVNNYSSLDKNNKNHYPPSLHALLEKVYELRTEKKLSNGFNIYLLPDNIKAEQLSKLDIKKLKPEGEPLFTTDDISSYLKDTHEFVLYYPKHLEIKKLKVPVSGTSFIVFVDGEPIYTGAFWNGFSSISFRGVAIDVSKLKGDYPVFKLELDYPPLAPKNIDFDPRPDERIFNEFKKYSRLHEQVWITGKCKKIRATGKRRQSFVFTFEVISVIKSTYEGAEISFEIHDDYGKSLRLAIEADSVANSYTEENWRFNAEKEILLKFVRRVSEKSPDIYLADFEVIN